MQKLLLALALLFTGVSAYSGSFMGARAAVRVLLGENERTLDVFSFLPVFASQLRTGRAAARMSRNTLVMEDFGFLKVRCTAPLADNPADSCRPLIARAGCSENAHAARCLRTTTRKQGTGIGFDDLWEGEAVISEAALEKRLNADGLRFKMNRTAKEAEEVRHRH